MRSDIASTRSAHRDPASSFEPAEIASVALLRWPENQATRTMLERARKPRLLLLAEGVVPPPASDDLEDWTRADPDSDEVIARDVTLSGRSPATRELRLSSGYLRRGSREVSLTGMQSVIIAPLIRYAGQPVLRAHLAGALRTEGDTPTPAAIRALLTRLDRVVAPLGLRISLLSGRAVMLEVHDE